MLRISISNHSLPSSSSSSPSVSTNNSQPLSVKQIRRFMNVDNLQQFDPLQDDLLGETDDVGSQAEHIHIRIQQRNGRKTLTTLQGLGKEYDLKKILKAFKKEFACNGNLVEDAELGQVIQLQGDQRQKINTFLIEQGVDKKTINVHGF